MNFNRQNELIKINMLKREHVTYVLKSVNLTTSDVLNSLKLEKSSLSSKVEPNLTRRFLGMGSSLPLN